MISLSDFVEVLARDLAKSKTRDLRTQLKLQQMQRRAMEIEQLLASGSTEEHRDSLQNELASLNADIPKKLKKLENVGMTALPITASRPSLNPADTETGVRAEGDGGEYEAAEDVFENPLQKSRAPPPEDDVENDSGDFT